MTIIDKIVTSSAIVYLMLVAFGIHIYLKKTGKTFLEMCQQIKEFIRETRAEE